jgi:16S rRNA (guanine527-N7)-methyltransferase
MRAGLPAIPGSSVPPEVLAALGDHVRLLIAWNKAINLSGIREAETIALEHVLDSLTALPLLRRYGINEFLDLGSGGGYPGLPLAVALPARAAVLVESVGKKARFLETAVAALGLTGRVGVAATRAEALARDPQHRGLWQAALSRAMADLTELAEVALPLLAPGGLLVAWKRRPIDEELGHAAKAVRQMGGRVVALEEVVVPGLTDHVLAVVEKVAVTPPEFPRDPAARRRRPL